MQPPSTCLNPHCLAGAPGPGLLPLLPRNCSKEKQQRHTGYGLAFFIWAKKSLINSDFLTSQTHFWHSLFSGGSRWLEGHFCFVQLLVALQILLQFLENNSYEEQLWKTEGKTSACLI